jgi:hypothetical protein
MKLITLQEWAKKSFGIHFSNATLNKWSRESLINPAPSKIGNRWLVHPDAMYIEKSIEAQLTDRAIKEVSKNEVKSFKLSSKLLKIINNDSKTA